MISIKYVFAAILLLFMLSCESKDLTKLQKNDVILAFGDSLTSGIGVTRQNSYPSILQNLSGYTVINAGIPGETTKQGLLRLAKVLEEEQPNLVILLEGGNDILRNLTLSKTKDNLSEMISLIQTRGAQVLLVGVPLKSIFSSDCADFYKELAKEYQVILECDFIGQHLRDNRYKSDAIHFNEAGYTLLAEKIVSILRNNGAM